MHKRVAVILAACSFAVWSLASHAAEVSISGTHSKDEIKNTCAKEGGSFYSNPHGVYGCSKGGNTVECTAKETCKGYTAEMTSGGQTGGKRKVLDVLHLPSAQIQGVQGGAASKAGAAATTGTAVTQ